MFSLSYETSIYPNLTMQEMGEYNFNKLVINTIISNLNQENSKTF